MSSSTQDHLILEPPSQRISEAFAPKNLEQAGRMAIEKVARHFERLLRREGAVLNWAEPSRNSSIALAQTLNHSSRSPAEQVSLAEYEELVDLILGRGQNLHHPRYLGHQVPASIPLAGVFDAIGTLTNQVMAVYEMGPWATAVEQVMVNELGQRLGWTAGSFAGVATHGGSLANLTALLTARNVCCDQVWSNGLARGETRSPVLVANADVHYSVTRAAGILGIGTHNVHKVPLDARRRMRPEALDSLLHDLKLDGHPVIAVSACACATPTGAFDPLNEIAEVCAEHNVWMHVDAAHGGAFAMSRRHRAILAGIERADSVVWDAHKMMFMPALCAFVLLRNRDYRFRGFQQDAPYLFDATMQDLVEYDLGHRTVECTKRATALGLWATWSLFGPELFEDLIDRAVDQTRFLANLINSADDFALLHEPQCNILVFRHIPERLRTASLQELGQFQLRLRRSVIESGEFYIVQTQIDGQGALRVTLMNPLTSADDLQELLVTLRKHGQKLLAEQPEV